MEEVIARLRKIAEREDLDNEDKRAINEAADELEYIEKRDGKEGERKIISMVMAAVSSPGLSVSKIVAKASQFEDALDKMVEDMR